MKHSINLFFAAFFIISLSSCGRELRPFTTNILREGNWSDSELSKIQFYLSDDIVIRRKLTEGSNEISSGGSIKIVKGEKVEEVRVKAGTPGVFLFRANDNHFAIGFDATNDKRYLMFGANPKRQGSYVLLASEWKDRYGKVRYDDRFFFTDEQSAIASLLVDFRKIRHTEVSSRTERGRKVQ
ncbi:MAG: hypothetical protein JNL70_15415 [Saprospiraceae bacterium]|nr:hypothetical protein [Saprospiraceae bacterium]